MRYAASGFAPLRLACLPWGFSLNMYRQTQLRRYAPLMSALCPMGEVHMRACVRSFGAVASTTLETKHREVHSPEGVNWGHLSTLRSKFAEVHSPEGVD